VNHYERLKVTQDAPAEVIRAAYRALAGKLHPDRHGGLDTGPQDGWHEQMVALNTAYEILIDPQLRSDYDATLAQPPSAAADTRAEGDATSAVPPARVDLDWLAPHLMADKPAWPPSRRVAWLVGGGSAVLTLLALLVVWQLVSSHQMDQALSDHYATMPASPSLSEPSRPAQLAGEDGALDAGSPSLALGDRSPTVDELARMSDDELLKALPALDARASLGAPPPALLGRRDEPTRPHPLDGKPLQLRPDAVLVDPLAPDAKP